MKDLDFDELDRAVNSLMTNVPKSAPQRNDEKVNTLDIAPTLDDKDATPPFKKVEEAAANVASDQESDSASPAEPAQEPAPKEEVAPSVPTTTSLPQAPVAPAARRGGRFMDVVHPSADMSKPDAPRPISRQGATIEPLGASQKIADIVPKKREATEKTESTDEDVQRPKEEPVAISPQPAVEPEAKAEESTSTSDWPDPLDLMSPAKDEKKDAEVPEPEAANDEEPTPPLTSPFLPDTKVEKRPLGGIPSEEEPSISEVEEPDRAPVIPVDATPKTVDDPNAQLPADPNAVEPQLPEELSGDMMAVEADTTHDELKQAHESTNDTTAPAPSVPKTTEPKTVVATSEPPVPSGPTSIPQQYREEPNTGDKDNVPIYDTDTYHQPLSHPAKKKSGWMWVIWIVLILLVGAGGGAALYFLGLV